MGEGPIFSLIGGIGMGEGPIFSLIGGIGMGEGPILTLIGGIGMGDGPIATRVAVLIEAVPLCAITFRKETLANTTSSANRIVRV
ncbi:MAG: hypothetical protein P8Z30_02850 [Acidobacteriota bacterium]